MLKTSHEVLSVCLFARSELHVINFIETFLSKDPIFHV